MSNRASEKLLGTAMQAPSLSYLIKQNQFQQQTRPNANNFMSLDNPAGLPSAYQGLNALHMQNMVQHQPQLDTL